MPVEALRGIPWTLLTYAATRVVTLATTLVLARLLAPEDFGLFAMALLGMELLSVFSGLWLGAALIVRPDLGRRGQGTVLTLLMAAGAVFALGLLAATPFVAAFFDEPRLNRLVTVLAAVLVVSGVNWFYETLLQRELAFRRRFAAQMVRTVAFSVVALELALLGAEAWSLPVAYLCGHLAHAIALLTLTPYRVRPAFDREEARRIVRGGRGFLGQDLATFLSQNADYLAVGRILGPAQLGFYAMAYRQAELPHYAIAEPVGKVTFPAFAQMRQRGEDVRSAFLDVLRMIALVTCPAGVVLSAAAVPFTLALLGEEWLPMAAPLAVLGIWALMRPLQVTVGNLLNSLGRAHVYGRVSLVALPPLVVATFAAAPLGTAAVAWVLVAHMTATCAVLVAAAARHAGVRAGALAHALWPFAVATAVAWVLTRATATATRCGARRRRARGLRRRVPHRLPRGARGGRSRPPGRGATGARPPRTDAAPPSSLARPCAGRDRRRADRGGRGGRPEAGGGARRRRAADGAPVRRAGHASRAAGAGHGDRALRHPERRGVRARRRQPRPAAVRRAADRRPPEGGAHAARHAAHAPCAVAARRARGLPGPRAAPGRARRPGRP